MSKMDYNNGVPITIQEQQRESKVTMSRKEEDGHQCSAQINNDMRRRQKVMMRREERIRHVVKEYRK